MNLRNLPAMVVILAAVMFFAFPYPGPAAELAGVTMPDTIDVAGDKVQLVGQGLRKILFIKVYVSGLYLEKPTSDPAEVINSEQAKRLVLEWKYKEVKAEKLQKEYRERIEANTPERSADLDARIDRFISFFSGKAVRGDRFIYTYQPGVGTEVSLSGAAKGTIEGADFMKALFKVWFGEDPFDNKLKRGLLGQ